jgi:hypothetical protein
LVAKSFVGIMVKFVETLICKMLAICFGDLGSCAAFCVLWCGAWVRWGDERSVGNTDGEICARCNGESKMAMDASTVIGVDGCGIGIKL